MINANEIADLMGVSKATAYKIIRQLNAELKESGCRTIQGRVSRDVCGQIKVDTWGC